MRYSIEWQNDAINAAPEERATVADLRLFIRDQNVTKHIFDDELGDQITIALYGLVEGIVYRWWSIFGVRDQEFLLNNFRMGYLFPDIRIHFDGAAFEFSAHQCVYTDPDLRFWGGTREVLSREEGESRLSTLIEEVLARLDEQGVTETSAASRWRRVLSSRCSDERIFCEAVGSLGLDPYQIADDVADFVEKAEQQFTAEPLVEFVSGSEEVDRSRLIDWVNRMTRTKGSRYHLAELRPIVDKIANEIPMRPGEQAWAVGYRRARAMRDAFNLKQHKRFSSFRDLARLLGASASYNLAPKVDGISALRREAPDGIHVHIRNHGDFEGAKATHMFALARAIGDAACFTAPETSPINRLQRAYRQAAGRAFAAEFLAPIDEIRSMQEEEHDKYSIADEFGVSPYVIEHQIENQERITEACA